MQTKPSWQNIAKALKHISGYLVVTAGEEDLIVMTKKHFKRLRSNETGQQLALTQPEQKDDSLVAADDQLKSANRELDLEQIDYPPAEMPPFSSPEPNEPLDVSPRQKVKFEPLKGDLPPDLQE